MFYILEGQHHTLVGRITYPNMTWGLDFTKGKLLETDFGEGQITIELEQQHASLPDYFELDATPIISEKFVKTLKSLPFDNYQLFPVTIKYPEDTLPGFYILNVIGLVPCINQEASDCKMYEGIIMRINNLVMLDNLPDLELFRAEEFPLAIFISERIKTGLETGALSGLLMQAADGWNDRHRF